jgi:hypothetical protein
MRTFFLLMILLSLLLSACGTDPAVAFVVENKAKYPTASEQGIANIYIASCHDLWNFKHLYEVSGDTFAPYLAITKSRLWSRPACWFSY